MLSPGHYVEEVKDVVDAKIDECENGAAGDHPANGTSDPCGEEDGRGHAPGPTCV